MAIAQNDVVSIHYTLRDDAEKVIDSSASGEPLTYLHGHGNLIAGLERELTGKNVGDHLKVRIAPAEGYGEYDEDLVQRVPRRALKGVPNVRIGMRLQAQTQHGARAVTVTQLTGDLVTLDGNHPLAGQDIIVDVELLQSKRIQEDESPGGFAPKPGTFLQ